MNFINLKNKLYFKCNFNLELEGKFAKLLEGKYYQPSKRLANIRVCFSLWLDILRQ